MPRRHETPNGGEIAKRHVEGLDLRARLAKRHTRPAIHPATEQPEAPLAPQMLEGLVDLHNADALKRAIIYYEIFSPPKALRRRQELWEM